jgi:hypothetical protein
LSLPRKKIQRRYFSAKRQEFNFFHSPASPAFASIRQVPTVLASPGRRVANAFGGFAISTTSDIQKRMFAYKDELFFLQVFRI